MPGPQESTRETPDPRGPGPILSAHHRQLEILAKELMGRVYEDDPLELVEQYRVFERETLEHLASEEEIILPALERERPDAADAMRADHAEIRNHLYKAAIDVELHVVRAGTMLQLLRALQIHAAHEDANVYPWAEANLDPEARQQLFIRLDASLHALAQLEERRPTVMPSA